MHDRPPYNRTALHLAARGRGDHTPADMARRLGLSEATAWRLWTGATAPSAHVAAAVERHYRIPASLLIADTAPEAV